jgi:diadenosine tetraphosphate (Ap4A) HIT family hydrolase
MPRDAWDALVRGENCPLCAAVNSDDPADSHGCTIADLLFSRLRLAANQYCPGYCVLICHRHVREPYELGRHERVNYFEDLMRAAQAIEAVFQPIKMNFEILGNAVPHLHCHIIPRYYGDPSPGAPLNPDAGQCALPQEEYAKRVQAIREALE